jgi:hypothetical protein
MTGLDRYSLCRSAYAVISTTDQKAAYGFCFHESHGMKRRTRSRGSGEPSLPNRTDVPYNASS